MNSEFRIAAAQVASVRGNLEVNIRTHAAAIAAAGERGIAVLVFPELSLTGYEPDLAVELAITPADDRLVPLRDLARHHGMEVVVGAPLPSSTAKPHLGAILFTATGQARTYSKIHLGTSEWELFTPGTELLAVTVHGQTIGFAICADSSQPAHPQAYAEAGASIYAAGVFLNAGWYATDAPRLASYAARHQMLVVMANHADSAGTYRSVGRSAVWAPDGALLAQADGPERCLVIATKSREDWRAEVVQL